MKFPNLFFTLALALSFTACDKTASVPALDPKVAFSKALESYAVEVGGVSKEKATNPMELMKKLPAILAKLGSIPTTGLPEDLAAAFQKVVKVSGAMGSLVAMIPADLPTDPTAMPAFMQAHPEVMKSMMEMQTKMGPLKTEAIAAQSEFEAAAKKNGLDVSKFIQASTAMDGK